MPHDAWFINRANFQPGDEFFLSDMFEVLQNSSKR